MKKKSSLKTLNTFQTSRKGDLLYALNAVAASIQRSSYSEEHIYKAFKKEIPEIGLHGSISLLSSEGTQLIFKTVVLPKKILTSYEKMLGKKVDGFTVPFHTSKSFLQVKKTNRSIYLPQAETFIRQLMKPALKQYINPVIQNFGKMAIILVPLRAKSKIIGFLHIAGQDLTAQDIPTIEAFANHIVITLENTRLFSESKEAETRYRLLLENSRDAIIQVKQNGQLLFVNKSFQDIFGYSLSTIIRKPGFFHKQLHPAYRKIFIKTVQQFRSKRFFPKGFLELGWFHKKGHIVYTEAMITPCLDEQGHEMGFQIIAHDITARKKAEEAVLQSEHEKSLILSTVSEQVIYLDDQYRILWANKAVADSLGMSQSKTKGKHCYEIFYSAKQKCLHCPAITSQQSGLQEEVEFTGKDGGVWFIRSYPVFNIEKKLEGMVIIRQNITERRYTERKLLESETLFRNLVENAKDGIVIIQDQKIRYANPRLAEMLGYELEEEIGKRFQDFVVASERERIGTRYEQRIRGEPIPRNFETIVRHKSGKQIFIEASAGLISYQAKPAVLSILRDITERKNLEKAFEQERKKLLSVFDNLEEVVYVSDPKTYEILYINQAVVKIFGNVLGQCCYKVFQHLDAPCDFCSNPYIFEENFGKPYIWEFQNLVTKQWYRCIDKAIEWPDGRKVRYEMAIDITNRKKVERDMLKAKEEAEKANHAKSDFLSSMSHELRTPLTSILGFAELFQSKKIGNLSEKDMVFIDRILYNGKHLLSLINGLLDLAQIESGKMKKNIHKVNLKELIEECLSSILPLVKKSVKLDSLLPDFVPPVYTDGFKLRQVLLNLLGNASKFTQEGTIKLELIVLPQSSPFPVQIRVSDTGIGIDKNQMDSIFEKFHPLDSEARSRFGGTGIGLYLSKTIMTLLGGEIAMESKYGKGSTFTILLPAEVLQKSAEIKN